jgi:hypothetical protein
MAIDHKDIKTTMIYVSLGKSHIREQGLARWRRAEIPRSGRISDANPFHSIGQTPARESDRHRLEFRMEADSEGWRAGLTYE